MGEGASAPVPPEPVLGAEDEALLARGLELFNRRHFFECHDVLEELWSGMRGEPRSFFQGLIQAAVGFYHLGNGNRTGARTTLQRSLERLAGYPERYAGVELEPLRAAIAEWLRALDAGGGLPAEPPRIAHALGGARASGEPE